MDQLPPPTKRLAVDRLSTVPDPILAEILSLVPTKTAVSTSVLSTRWRSVWTQITSIHLDYNHFPQHSSDFYTIANNLLLTQLTSPVLRTFYLHAPFRSRQHFESWFRHLSARNVEIIDINVEDDSKLSDTTSVPPFTIPLCIFQTQSLVCLNFRPTRLDYVLPVDPHTVVNLPNLKRLGLSLIASQCLFVSKLVSSCPLLDDFSLTAAQCSCHGHFTFDDDDDDDTGDLIDISCGILKRLELNTSYMKVKVLIDTPKLESFSLKGIDVACCFVKKPIALSEATIITNYPRVVAPIMPVLFDVRVLQILGTSLHMFEGFKDDKGNLLVFHNLTELNLESSTEGVDELIMFRLKSPSPCLLLKVKKINLVFSSVEYGLNLMKLAHYLLGNAPALERLSFVLGPQARQSEDGVKFRLDEMVFCMDLYSCSRESSGCQIEFQGQYAKVPANIAEFQDMENQVVLLRESLSPVDADAVKAS
ncbi:F-box/LRR-repeat protein At3g26922-like [Silene latifolia]|uniref:F-box/LRR-repeat protein At3g26922-like n=1 Tax=Silene latifolia TaxID=37657 RepID=UPI003D770978